MQKDNECAPGMNLVNGWFFTCFEAQKGAFELQSHFSGLQVHLSQRHRYEIGYGHGSSEDSPGKTIAFTTLLLLGTQQYIDNFSGQLDSNYSPMHDVCVGEEGGVPVHVDDVKEVTQGRQVNPKHAWKNERKIKTSECIMTILAIEWSIIPVDIMLCVRKHCYLVATQKLDELTSGSARFYYVDVACITHVWGIFFGVPVACR